MGQVIQAEQFWPGQKPPFHSPPPPPPPMDASERLAKIETVLPTLATKEEMHKEFNAQTWRIIVSIITVCTLLTSAVFFIARNVK